MSQTLQKLYASLNEIATLGSIGSVLGWDEQTYQPPKATPHRAAQSTLIAKLTHERMTSPQLEEQLAAAEAEKPADENAKANLRELRRTVDRQKKLPTSLVESLAHTAVLSQDAWARAKQSASFAAFSPWLEKTIDLKRQEAECYGYGDKPYDALLDSFEPGETAASVQEVFDGLRPPIVELVGKIVGSGRKAPIELFEREYSIALQESFAREAAARIGYDLEAGRIDATVHPFCTGIGPGDTRITTRFDSHQFSDAFFSVLHETGHALYEQGLNKAEHFGQPIADAISLGIHESQSRLWENLVGRSHAFWEFHFPLAKKHFAPTINDVSMDDWLFAINDVRPSLIRTESDETTYNLHVMLRFELEQALVGGELNAKDLPSVWNEKMRAYFGLVPPNDALGCLQDVHWSAGLFGYFPTYALGNLYAAQLFEAATQQLGDQTTNFAAGRYAPLLQWLRSNVHQHGQRYRARELIQRVTGQTLNEAALMRHLGAKAAHFYNV